MKQLIFTLSIAILAISTTLGLTDKYRLIITDDPATTMTVGWNQISGHSVAVFYDEVDHGQEFMAYENFQLPDRNVTFKSMNNYFVRLKNLKPNTAYYFVIADNEGVSQRFWFKTLPDDPTMPLSIIAGGDSRRSGSQTDPHEPRIQSNKIVKTIRPDFVAFGGDYTDKDTDGQWVSWMDDWQYTIGEDGRMIPILATRGNHERSNTIVTNLFDVQQDDVYYALNFGGSLIRFYTLNVMISVAGEQTNWLAQDLEANQTATAWKLAQYHYPIAPHQSGKPYRTSQYIHWAPLFHKHQMQLIIECDSHIAKNSWPVKPSDDPEAEVGFIRDDETGTYYTGEGSWGLTRRNDVAYNWTRETGSFTQVKWIHANLDSLVIYTIKSATSDPSNTIDDNDRFKMPGGLDLWVTENGDRLVIDRPNPEYAETTVSTRSNSTIVSLVRRVFPNPAQSKLNVQLKEAGSYPFEIFGISGKAITTGNLNDTNSSIDLANFNDGIYYLRVWNENLSGSQVISFVKN